MLLLSCGRMLYMLVIILVVRRAGLQLLLSRARVRRAALLYYMQFLVEFTSTSTVVATQYA